MPVTARDPTLYLSTLFTSTMPADTLFNLAQRAAARLHAGIESVGDLPWELVRPIILKIESPERLVRLSCALFTTDLTTRST